MMFGVIAFVVAAFVVVVFFAVSMVVGAFIVRVYSDLSFFYYAVLNFLVNDFFAHINELAVFFDVL